MMTSHFGTWHMLTVLVCASIWMGCNPNNPTGAQHRDPGGADISEKAPDASKIFSPADQTL